MRLFGTLLCLLILCSCQTTENKTSTAAPIVGAAPVVKEVVPEEPKEKSETEPTPERMTYETSMLGKTEKQLKQSLGAPKELQFAGCRINVQDTRNVDIEIAGEMWSYVFDSSSAGHEELDLCVFREVVVAERKSFHRLVGGLMISKIRSLTDHRLIRKLLLDKTKTDKDLLMEKEGQNYPKSDL